MMSCNVLCVIQKSLFVFLFCLPPFLSVLMEDLSVQQIMGDPVMQSILQQAQGNPAALQDHMKNPIVRDKINKLINAGIIRTR